MGNMIWYMLLWHVGISLEDQCDLFMNHRAQGLLRSQLEKYNCLQEVEIVEPGDSQRAARLFHRDGYVVIRDALPEPLQSQLRGKCLSVAEEIIGRDPRGIGNRGPLRYSLGPPHKTGHLLHHIEWAKLIELPAVNDALKQIFGDDRYIIRGARGDFNLPGAPYQPLHSDMWDDFLTDASPTEFADSGKINHRHLPVHYIAVNYLVSPLNSLNAPIRQIPLTAYSQRPIPSLRDEPLWMKRSTLCPLPAGTAIIRDARAWHGGTPNLSDGIRCMPNIEYYAYWYRYHDGRQMTRSMPRHIYDQLSPFAQNLCREVVAMPSEEIDASIKDDVTVIQSNVISCYKKLGLTDEELSTYNASSGAFFNYSRDAENFYRRPGHPDESFGEEKDEL